jgi:uncharacterized protein (UPF0332 family)
MPPSPIRARDKVLTKERYLQQAAHNEKFFFSFDIEKTEFRDWAVVGAFYSAVHLINAYLLTQGYEPKDHHTRDNAIKMYSVTKKIAWEYSELKNHAFNARYKAYRFSAKEIKEEVSPPLEAIKKQILASI